MSELDFERNAQKSFAEGWVKEYTGRPIAVVASEGYWQIPEDSQDKEEPQQIAVSAERHYSLGIIAAGEVKVEEAGIVVPVEGFVTWDSSTPYVQDLQSRFDWGLEWFDAEVSAGEGGLILPRIKDPKDPERAWDFGSFGEVRVPTNGKTLGLHRGMTVEGSDTVPGGTITDTFAEVDISVNAEVGGNSGSRYIITGIYHRDELWRRITAGDASALEEASDPKLKKAAEKAAKQDYKRNPPKKEPEYDPWDPLA